MVPYLTPILHTLAHMWYIFEKKGILWYVKRVCKMSKKSHDKAPINKGYFGMCSKNQAKCNFHLKHTTNVTFPQIQNSIQDHIVKIR